MNIFEPIVQSVMKELNCNESHNGLDLRLKREHGNTGPQDRSANAYEIMFSGRGFGDNVFPTKNIAKLLDQVINRYYYDEGSVKEKANEKLEPVFSRTEFTIEDAKHISKIVETETGYDFHTVKEEVSEEVKQIAADLFHLLAVAKSGIEDRTMQVNDKMKVGTLDINKHTLELYIHTANGPIKYEKDQVSKTILTTSLWYILRLHQGTKEFLKYLNFDVEYKGYKAKIIKGEVTLEKEGLSQLQIEIHNDLKRMK